MIWLEKYRVKPVLNYDYKKTINNLLNFRTKNYFDFSYLKLTMVERFDNLNTE